MGSVANSGSLALVAQLDRALASEAKGCGFDPRRAHRLQGSRSACRALGQQARRLPYVIRWNFRLRENSLSQCFHSADQILLARYADDLIAQLAVLEKKQRRNRANVVLG